MTALERWKAAGLVEVPLPSGFRIKVVPVTPATLVLLDLAPTIVDEVLDARTAGVPDEEAAAKVGNSALDVAVRAVRYLWDDETKTWEPVSLTVADLVAGGFLPDDVEALMDAALSRLAGEEAAVTEDDLRGFRDESTGDGDREDGGAVRPTPLEPRRARRSAARTGARRGAGAPAVAG